jgi:hypothetical protein
MLDAVAFDVGLIPQTFALGLLFCEFDLAVIETNRNLTRSRPLLRPLEFLHILGISALDESLVGDFESEWCE